MENLASVFLIINRSVEPDYEAIWRQNSIRLVSGSGFGVSIKSKNYIITNAHVIDHSNFLECIKYNSDKKFQVRVRDVAQSIDLAILEVLDPDYEEFWSGVTISEIAKPCGRGETVFVVGFPLGGFNPSVTQGIVSRISTVMYSQVVPNLAIQVDSAINPGNSGGPVFDNSGKIVGVAFSHTNQAQNMCYIIPAFILQHYMAAIVKFGKYPGICELGIRTSGLENPILARYYGAKKPGILIISVDEYGPSRDQLKPEDIIHEIDNTQINNDKSIYLENYEIVRTPSKNTEKFPYWHILRLKHIGEHVKMLITRGSKQITIDYEIRPDVRPLIPVMSKDISNEYYIYAGIVFCCVNRAMLRAASQGTQSEKNIYAKYLYERPDSIEQVVIVSDILTSAITTGYSVPEGRLVSINSKPIKNISDVYEICETGRSGFIKFEFEYGEIIILDSVEALQISEEISQTYLHIPYHNHE